MLEQILALSKQLISFPSTKDNTGVLFDVLDYAKGYLSGFSIEEFTKNNTPSILVHNQKKGEKHFKIILNAHLDVVAGTKEQFVPFIKSDRLYGRGAIDMKSAAAVELLVFKEVASQVPYPLALQLVTDEEIGGYFGTKHQINQGVRADFTIAGEPTDFGINNQAKGIVWAKISTIGKTGHGAYVWNGENALWKINQILNRIKKAFPLPKKVAWKTTLNLARVETSNVTFNKIPDAAEAWVDIRFIPHDSQTVIPELQKAIGKEGTLELLENEPAQFTDQQNQFVKQLKQSVKKITGKTAKTIVKHGGSDIRHFNGVGCDGVTFGPTGVGLHSDEEWVSLESLSTYYRVLYEYLTHLT